MSLNMPARRLVRTALTTSPKPLYFLAPSIQHRAFSHSPLLSAWFSFSRDKNYTKADNPLTEEYLKRKPKQPKLVRGDLAEDSTIFDDEKLAGPKAAKDAEGQSSLRNPLFMAAALDPDPASRRRWERKMVIRDIKKRGRLSKTQQLKKEERVLISKSHNWRTSVKKLVPLAKQITGKTVEDAIIQMRFSKKKAAKEVRDQLVFARNEAIVKRGMGLGLAEGEKFNPVTIMTNKGKRVKVTDPTTLYVDQAWCGKGKYGYQVDYRAMGRAHMMKNRTTHIALVLKEEKTRVRLHEERETKEKNKKVWTQLPNRPITAQRQYYSW